MSSYIPLINFAKTLAGKYSNKAQAERNPRYYAHINIYYRPLDWSFLSGPWFYSEQSYDYAPWNPYKQNLHKLLHIKNTFIVENYALKAPERVAGSGFKPDLLTSLKQHEIHKREGCSMHFKEIRHRHYQGSIEPGRQCIIKRNKKITYLLSKVEFNERSWVSLDEGIDTSNHKKVWGSDHGELKFKKIEVIGINIIEKWINKISLT